MQSEMNFGVEAFKAIFGSNWIEGSTTLEFVSQRTPNPGDARADGIWVRPHDGGSDFLLDDPASSEEKFVRFLHPTGDYETEPALPFPFTLTQFQRFCETYARAGDWMDTFCDDDGSLIDPMEGGYASPEDYKIPTGDLSDDGDGEIPLSSIPFWRRHPGAWSLLTTYFARHDAVMVAESSGAPEKCVPDDEAIDALAAVNPAAGRLMRQAMVGATENVDTPTQGGSVAPTASVDLVTLGVARADKATSVLHRLASRRDVLDPAIDAAIERAGTAVDDAAVWNALYAMASEPAPKEPLIGAAEGDVKYRDGKGDVTAINRKALSKRLKRRQ